MVAESREDARQKVIQDCGMVMGGSIHSTLPDEEINWAFSTHPDVRTGRITVQVTKIQFNEKFIVLCVSAQNHPIHFVYFFIPSMALIIFL